MITKKQAKLLDECTNGKWRKFVHSDKIEKNKGETNGLYVTRNEKTISTWY